MKMFSDCSGPCETCKTHFLGRCMAGHGDDDYDHADAKWLKTIEKRIEKAEKIKRARN